MTEIADLKVGDEVILTIKARVDIRDDADGEQYAYFDYAKNADYVIVEDGHLKSGVVTIKRIITPPLPTEEGRYVTRSNAKDVQGAQIHTLDGGVWSQFTGEKVIENSLDAPWGTRYAHENLGGLVRLVPEQ